jgi:nitrogen-specific signal transduction histidine kinase
LQQVLLNLIINAIQSMSGVHDRPRDLVIRCKREALNDGLNEGESVGAIFRIVLPSKGGVEVDQIRS